MSIKLAVVADVHLDVPFTWAGPEVGRRWRTHVRDTLTNVVEVCLDRQVDALLVAGDLYEHDRFSPDTVRFVEATFAKLDPLPVLVAPGNHDWLAPAGLYRQARFGPNVHLFTTDHLEPVTLVEGCTLWGAAHLRPRGTDGFLDRFRVDRSGLHLAVFHGSEVGGFALQGDDKRQHAPFHAAQVAEAGLAFAFVGHYHHPTRSDHHAYPGSPQPLSFGAAAGGLLLADVADDGTVGLEHVDVAAAHLHDLQVDVSECLSGTELRDAVRGAVAGLEGAARIDLVGDLALDLEWHDDLLRDVGPGLDALKVRTSGLRPAVDLEALAALDNVEGEFIRLVRDLPDLDADIRRRVVLTGLRALSGRSDLEVP
jgi:DNA repair exonuclease SbcCD nuclease subunit